MGFTNLAALIRDAGITIPSKKTKVLLVGTHAQQTTGYSKVTWNIVQELAKYTNFDLYHFGFQKFLQQPPDYRVYPSNVTVYDPVAEKGSEEMGFGFSQLPEYIRKVTPDVVILYNDAGVICQFLHKLKDLLAEERKYKLIVYLDQVYTIQRPELLSQIDQDADIYFTFTEYWKNILAEQGIKKPIYVMKHGFDETQFIIKNREEIRKKHNISENNLILLNLNRNTPRKRHDIVVQAFAHIVARNPDTPLGLLCICDKGDQGGFPIQEIYMRELAKLGLPIQPHISKLMISQSALTYTDELINELYCMSDIGITAAEGEGFGLCQFEAMGVGIPQVVPYVGGFRDFCTKENAQIVQPNHRHYIPLNQGTVGGIAELVDPIELSFAAEKYVLDSELRKKHGREARNTVLTYKWSEQVKVLADVISNVVSNNCLSA